MFKTIRKAVKKYMDERVEDLKHIVAIIFSNKDFKNMISGGMIGFGLLGLCSNSKNNFKLIISSSIGLGVYGLLEYLGVDQNV